MKMPRSAALFVGLCVLGCKPPVLTNPAANNPSSGSGPAKPTETSSAGTSSADPKSAFVAAFRQASESKNVDQMLQLYCWDGIDAEMKETVRGNVTDELRQPVTDLQIVEPEPGKHGPTTEGGIRWRPNLPVVAVLKAQFAKPPPGSGWLISDAEYPLGLKDGQYRMVLSVREN